MLRAYTHLLLAHACNSFSLRPVRIRGREKEREKEKEGERGIQRERGRERKRDRKRERGRERCRIRCFIFLKGMTGALAPFSYLVVCS